MERKDEGEEEGGEEEEVRMSTCLRKMRWGLVRVPKWETAQVTLSIFGRRDRLRHPPPSSVAAFPQLCKPLIHREMIHEVGTIGAI